MSRFTPWAAVAAAFALCYAGVLRTLAEAWATSYAYSYGFVVLLVSAYMVWSQSARLRTAQLAPEYRWGIPVTLAGLALLAAGRLSLLASLQEASLIVTLAGFVLLFPGRQVFALVWFPLAYLLLGIPIWDRVITVLQPPSQFLSARIASSLLSGIGIPVLREGTDVVLPNVTLEVMRECSGVNQLLAIIAMALPAAFVALRAPGRRAALVAFAVVVAYLSNGVRIALTGFLAYRGLSNGDLRTMHLLEGLAVSAGAYLPLFGALSILAKGERAPRAEAQAHVAASERVAPPLPVLRARYAPLDGAIILVVLVVGVFQTMFRPAVVLLKTDLRGFPREVADWNVDSRSDSTTLSRFPALDDELVHAYPSPAGERRFATMDDELLRVYRNGSGQSLHLYIGYHRSQREGKELIAEAGHALNSVATPVSIPLAAGTVVLGQIVQHQPRVSRGVLYWYDFNGRTFTSIYRAKQYLAWDALTRRRTNGAIVMIGWEARAGSDPEVARAKALEFARAILPLLPRFIPS